MSVFNKTRSTDTVILYALRRMRSPLIALIVVFAIAILGLVLIPGTTPDGETWYMSFLDAFYFVSYMATTIGFGEFPYPFTPAQRLWVAIMIYPTVIIWLYAFGTILTLMQDATFKQALIDSAYKRSVRRIKTPFFLICGYGDTGHLLVRAMTEKHQQVVVIDIAQEAINELAIENHSMFVPGLGADASQSDHLLKAGINHENCIGIAAITDNDQANLKIAINSKLLNPNIEVACRVERKEVEANMASFGTDHLINPFEMFTDQIMLSLLFPNHYMLYELITQGETSDLNQMSHVPKGLWIICGYGRLGRTIHKRLMQYGVEIKIIDLDPEGRGAPANSVQGRGTEAVTLKEGDIDRAVGIIAATSDDADNLSILMTAKELNPYLYIVARQNIKANDALFKAIKAHKVMQNNKIVAHEVMARLSTPMLHQYVSNITNLSEDEAKNLTQQLLIFDKKNAQQGQLKAWQLHLDKQHAPAVMDSFAEAENVQLRHLTSDPWLQGRHLPLLALMIKRDEQFILLPDETSLLETGDTILFAGYNSSLAQSLLFQHEALHENMQYHSSC